MNRFVSAALYVCVCVGGNHQWIVQRNNKMKQTFCVC